MYCWIKKAISVWEEVCKNGIYHTCPNRFGAKSHVWPLDCCLLNMFWRFLWAKAQPCPAGKFQEMVQPRVSTKAAPLLCLPVDISEDGAGTLPPYRVLLQPWAVSGLLLYPCPPLCWQISMALHREARGYVTLTPSLTRGCKNRETSNVRMPGHNRWCKSHCRACPDYGSPAPEPTVLACSAEWYRNHVHEIAHLRNSF